MCVQKWDDVCDPRWVAGHLWWTDNWDDCIGEDVRREPLPPARGPCAGTATPSRYTGAAGCSAGVVSKTSVVTVGCGPGGNCPPVQGGVCKRR